MWNANIVQRLAHEVLLVLLRARKTKWIRALIGLLVLPTLVFNFNIGAREQIIRKQSNTCKMLDGYMDTSNATLVNLECTNGRKKMHMEKKFYMQELWTLGGSFLEKKGEI